MKKKEKKKKKKKKEGKTVTVQRSWIITPSHELIYVQQIIFQSNVTISKRISKNKQLFNTRVSDMVPNNNYDYYFGHCLLPCAFSKHNTVETRSVSNIRSGN
jgi:hypothetical protein